jgi:DNA-binding transcriptional MerR regulator/effector-binding domain-containing protein
MQARLGIGDFSRMTYLSVKALRHYHDVGVLEPVEVDPSTGYRFYAPTQVGLAQMVRRLRDLGMPLDEVRAIVRAPDARARDETLVAHLRRLEDRLARTEQSVASLRALLEQPDQRRDVVRLDLPVTPALAVVEQVAGEDAVAWWMGAFPVLHRAVAAAGATRAGCDGALFPQEFFTDEVGEVVAFVPVREQPDGGVVLPARVRRYDVPAAHLAALVHDGPLGDLDRTYGALGRWVLSQATGTDGPIREYYLPTGDPADLLAHRTRVCWPVRPAPS